MNVEPLREEHLAWCDCVFISAMLVQQESFREVVARCRKLGLPVIAGGPYPTSYYQEINDADYLVLGEVEDFFAQFLTQLENSTAKRVTSPPKDSAGVWSKPDITRILQPRYDLVNFRHYGSVGLQFSRGCPFDCEFCDITKLYGRTPRTKTNAQMLAELQLLYHCGWRGTIFMVDDNFIGNRSRVKHLLPAIAAWQRSGIIRFRFTLRQASTWPRCRI